MSLLEKPCPLCIATCQAHRVIEELSTLYMCPCCGHWEEDDQDFPLGNVPESHHKLSHFLRDRYERTKMPYRISDRVDGLLPKEFAELPMTVKLDRALLRVAETTHGLGLRSTCNFTTDWPLAQARDPEEFRKMLGYWFEEGALERNPAKDQRLVECGAVVTGKGWRIVDELRPSRPGQGNQAFVAMSFAEERERVYDAAIKPALESTGWTPLRVDREQFEDKICDRIVVEIRRSALMVVECTGQRPNVYFEAGFAMGLNIPVIWCVRQDEAEKNKLAFDIRQYPHIFWMDENDLKIKLTDRIAALYQRQP
jgi:hypothetical protein